MKGPEVVIRGPLHADPPIAVGQTRVWVGGVEHIYVVTGFRLGNEEPIVEFLVLQSDCRFFREGAMESLYISCGFIQGSRLLAEFL